MNAGFGKFPAVVELNTALKCRFRLLFKFGKTCRILAVTALRDPEDVKDIYAAGIDDYIAKPFKIEVLKDKIEHLLSVHAEA